ncbi:MAG: hypothetical protein ABI806_12925 [Candidatus Solibacter sp.]
MDKESTGTRLKGNVLALYMMTVMGMGVYYNWQYANAHGFGQWFFLGGIVPSAKALVWPYFVFGADQHPRPSQDTDGGTGPGQRQPTPAEQQYHDREAISKFNDVTGMLTRLTKLNIQYDGIKPPQPVLDQMKEYQDTMLKAGQDIDIEVLNLAYPELGNHFRDEFLRSLSLVVELENIGIEARKSGSLPRPLTPEMVQSLGTAKELSQQWADWYGMHYQEMLEALKNKWGR